LKLTCELCAIFQRRHGWMNEVKLKKEDKKNETE
jgi:hypothetical protein